MLLYVTQGHAILSIVVHSFLFIGMAIQQRDHGRMLLHIMMPVRTSIPSKGMTGTLYQLSASWNLLCTAE